MSRELWEDEDEYGEGKQWGNFNFRGFVCVYDCGQAVYTIEFYEEGDKA